LNAHLHLLIARWFVDGFDLQLSHTKSQPSVIQSALFHFNI